MCRLKHLLAQDGLPGSRRRLGRLRAQAGLRGTTRRQCQAPTTAGQAEMVAPHPRPRAWTVKEPDPVSVGAIPSLPTGAGWWYFAVVRDRGSRAVVGGSMADQRRAELVHQA